MVSPHKKQGGFWRSAKNHPVFLWGKTIKGIKTLNFGVRGAPRSSAYTSYHAFMRIGLENGANNCRSGIFSISEIRIEQGRTEYNAILPRIGTRP
jgi:hypothetical protein